MNPPYLRLLMIASFLSSCCYQPLKDKELYTGPRTPAVIAPGSVRATFLGNTTILISDGTTNLLVDGFFSRPGKLQTLLGKVGPNREVIRQELRRARISNVDAILVGHAHHDHALDAPAVAEMTGAVVVGSTSYRFIHEGAGGKTDNRHLITVTREREEHRFGKFVVTFVASGHVSSHSFLQNMVEGPITRPIKTPARFHDFKCGPVYALHIAHPQGCVGVTTTAGAVESQFQGLRSNMVFLGIGLLGKESESQRSFYWKESVEALNPEVVIPVHWDDFTRPLVCGLKPRSEIFDPVKKALDYVKEKAKRRQVRVMDSGDVIVIEGKGKNCQDP